MMYQPKKIVVGPATYTVNFVDNIEDHTLDGTISLGNRTIEVDHTVSVEHQRVVLMHEVLHALAYQHALPLKEEHIQALAFAMLDLIKDNPEFIAWSLQ